MRILTNQIKPGTLGVRVWPDLPPGDTDTGEPYPFSCLFTPKSKRVCWIEQAQGDMTSEIVVELGLLALSLGYEWIEFCRTERGPATRWATLVTNRDGMDYYEVYLPRAVAQYYDEISSKETTMSERFIRVTLEAGNGDKTYQTTTFTQTFDDREQQVAEQRELFPAVAEAVMQVMQNQK